MTDKMKERARELAAKSGMSYQAAYNQLRQSDARRGAFNASVMDIGLSSDGVVKEPNSASPDGVNMTDGTVSQASDFWNPGRHEPNCPLSEWTGPREQAPGCECLGIDYSLPLLDGDDYYD